MKKFLPALGLAHKFLLLGFIALVPLALCAGGAYITGNAIYVATAESQIEQTHIGKFNALHVANLEAVLAAMDSIVDKQEGKINPERMDIMANNLTMLERELQSYQAASTQPGDAEWEIIKNMLAFIPEYKKAMLETLPHLIETRASEEAFAAIDDAIDGGGEVIGGGLNQLIESSQQHAAAAVDTVQQQIQINLLATVGTAAIALVVLSVIIFMFARAFIVPITGLAGNFSELANYNLAVKASTSTHDEVGLMAGKFNFFVEKFRSLITATQTTTHQVANTAQAMSSSLTEITRTTASQREALSQISTAVEQSSATVHEINQQANNTARNAESIAAAIARMAGVMDVIKHNSDRIVGAADIIRKISDQTNLLALNAAIEAARAGDAGRGFAVVADEVRKLAITTGSSTDEIEKVIKEFRTNMEQVFTDMGQVSASIETITQGAERVSQALTQQSATTEELSTTITEFGLQVDATNTTLGEVFAAAGTLSGDAKNLSDQVSVFRL